MWNDLAAIKCINALLHKCQIFCLCFGILLDRSCHEPRSCAALRTNNSIDELKRSFIDAGGYDRCFAHDAIVSLVYK